MDLTLKTVEELEQRKNEIVELSATNENVEELRSFNEELDLINSELETRKANAKAEEELRKAVADGVIGEIKIEELKEDKKMDLNEIRSSKEYINAYANFIKTGDAKEVRALLSENVASTGQVPVPVALEEKIRHAWDDEELTGLVKKSYIRGNLKVGFEYSADAAEIHEEGAKAPDEEELGIGIVELVPESIKKWITISDEALDLAGEAFLNYIYDEITYQIAKKAADTIVYKVANAGTSSTASAPGQAKVTDDPALDTVAKAVAELSDEARNPVIVMNKKTYATFKGIQANANYGQDIFDGLKVVFNNSLPAFDTASAGDVYALVGDFGYGFQANFPNGQEISIKYDDLSLAESDLVKIVGREFVGLGVVAPKAFCQVAKEAAPEPEPEQNPGPVEA